MTWYHYGFALTWDAALADFTNFEDISTSSPLISTGRVPLGSVVNKALSGDEVTDGWRLIVLGQVGEPFGTTLFADLDTYITTIFGDWNTENAHIGLKTRERDGTYHFYNVIAHLPRIGTDYEQFTSTEVSNLKLRFTVIAEITPT